MPLKQADSADQLLFAMNGAAMVAASNSSGDASQHTQVPAIADGIHIRGAPAVPTSHMRGTSAATAREFDSPEVNEQNHASGGGGSIRGNDDNSVARGHHAAGAAHHGGGGAASGGVVHVVIDHLAPVAAPAAAALPSAGPAAQQQRRGRRPKLQLILLGVFEHEDAIIEREWLAHLDATCPDFELHVNCLHLNDPAAVATSGLTRLTTGRLTPRRLEQVLPPANLLTVSLCGTPNFVRDIREMYVSLGLPRSLLSVVG